MTRKKFSLGKMKYILLAAIIVSICLLIWITPLRDIINMLLISFLLSYAIKPIYKYMCSVGLNRRFSALILILSIITILLLIAVYIVPSAIGEGEAIYDSMEFIEEKVNKSYNYIIDGNKFLKPMDEKIRMEVKDLTDNFIFRGIALVKELVKNTLSIAIIPVITYYFLSQGEMIYKRSIMIVPRNRRNIVKSIIDDIDVTLTRYIFSQFVLSVIIFIVTFIILMTFKVDFALMLSLINAIANIIPYFGPIIGIIPAVIMAFFNSSKSALWVGVSLVILQEIEGNIISPKIIGDSVSIHPFIVVILLILGDKMGGFIGMIIVIPLSVVIKIIYEDINYYLF